jgi:hypothetical protein
METVLHTNSLSEMPAILETLEILMRSRPSVPYTVVFDIDDTIVRKNSDALPEVLELLFNFHTMGCIIGLVTARHDSMREFTIKELAAINIDSSIYQGQNLLFCPQEYRNSFTSISKWKQSARYFLKSSTRRKLLCTVGDQWTDLITIESDRERSMLDNAYGASTLRLMRLNDGLCEFGIKLPNEEVDDTLKAQVFLDNLKKLSKEPRYLLPSTEGDQSAIVHVLGKNTVQEIGSGKVLGIKDIERDLSKLVVAVEMQQYTVESGTGYITLSS